MDEFVLLFLFATRASHLQAVPTPNDDRLWTRERWCCWCPELGAKEYTGKVHQHWSWTLSVGWWWGGREISERVIITSAMPVGDGKYTWVFCCCCWCCSSGSPPNNKVGRIWWCPSEWARRMSTTSPGPGGRATTAAANGQQRQCSSVRHHATERL